MKAVLISIQPKWCELIASGIKTVEVRKTRPKCETPFKVYIYCTKNKHFFKSGGMRLGNDDLYRLPNGEIKYGCSVELMSYGEDEYDETNFLNGRVIGEFVCDSIIQIGYNKNGYGLDDFVINGVIAKSCVPEKQLYHYLQGKKPYLWHISDLVIYDKPKELSEFYRHDTSYDNSFGGYFEDRDKRTPITRPPQSWCYVKEG